MPTFEITSPSGTKFNVTGENAQGAMAALQQHLGDGQTAQTQPKSVGGFMENVGESAKNALVGAYKSLPQMAYDMTLPGMISKLSPWEIPGQRDFAATFGAQPNSLPNEVNKGRAIIQNYGDKYGSLQNAGNTAYNDPVGAALDASMLLSGGETAAARIPMLSRAAPMLGAASRAVNPISLVTKPLSFASSVGPLQRSAIGTVASDYGVPARAMKSVADSVGDIPAAQQSLSLLGNDAAIANLTPDTIQAARRVTSIPLTGDNAAAQRGLLDMLKGQVDNSGARAGSVWDSVVGPAKSGYQKQVETAATKAGTSSIYELAKGRVVDPTPVMDALPEIMSSVEKLPEAKAAITQIHDMLVSPQTGFDLANNAQDLLAARHRIDELITKAGQGQSGNPFADPYALGQKTTTGRPLVQLRNAIQQTLHQDATLKAADNTFASAAKGQAAFDLGSTGIIGRGNSVLEPDALAARFAKMTPQEKTSLLEGLGRKGQTLLGDVRHNMNDGKSMADTIATQNNLARLRALGLNADAVANSAAREDALASSANRIMGGSDTARTDLAASRFPMPNASVNNVSKSLVAMGGILGASGLHVPGLLAAATGGVGLIGNKIINGSRVANLAQSAKLLGLTGAEAEKLLQSLKDAKPTPRINGKKLSRYSLNARNSLLGGQLFGASSGHQ